MTLSPASGKWEDDFSKWMFFACSKWMFEKMDVQNGCSKWMFEKMDVQNGCSKWMFEKWMFKMDD